MGNINVTRSSMPDYEEYCAAIKPLWESHWLTNMGKYHDRLEKDLSQYLGVPQISLTVNGHMALEMAIQSFDFPDGAEVITTPFTFVSTTHAIVRNRLTPVFCDVKESDGTIDETKIEGLITDKTVAILPVHVYGNICNVDAIQEIAERHHLKVIYDSAHAFGEKYRGNSIGNYGDVSIFSFHATKVFNTIEGGAVVCKTNELYDKLYNLKNFGIRDEETVEAVGANAKMNEFCAIMGLLNLKHINEAIKYRKAVYNKYIESISHIRGISTILSNEDDMDRNYGYFPVKIGEDYKMTRDELYEKLRLNGINSRKYFYPITSDQKCYRTRFEAGSISVARKLGDRCLVIPIYEDMPEEVQNKVISLL